MIRIGSCVDFDIKTSIAVFAYFITCEEEKYEYKK